MADFKYGAIGSVVHLHTTALDSLPSGGLSALSSEYDNTSGFYQTVNFYLHIASSSLALTAASLVKIYSFPSDNGSNYPKVTTGSSPVLSRQNYLIGTMSLYPTTLSSSVLDEWLTLCTINPGKQKFAIEYIGGGAGTWPSSGNTFDMFPFYNSVA